MPTHEPTASVGERSEDSLLDAIVPVDGVRIVGNLRPGVIPLEEHPDLNLSRTAPIGSTEKGKLYGKFQGLHFIFQGGKRWIIKGSLHRFANGGRHNADDFRYRKLLWALLELETRFGLCLETTTLENLETGLNFHRVTVQRFIDSIIWQGDHPVRDMQITDGKYHGTEHTDYFSGNYDKGRHFRDFPEYADTLRIEKKCRNARAFRDTGIRSLADLRNPFCLVLLAEMLVKMWGKDTLFFDNDLLRKIEEFATKDREKILRWSSPKYWEDLKRKQTAKTIGKNRFRDEWKEAEKFQSQHSDLKAQISETMAAKFDALRRFTTENPEKAGNFIPPCQQFQGRANTPKQGNFIGGYPLTGNEETGKFQGLSKGREIPDSDSGISSLTREQLFDALGMDEGEP